jgi:hypothetical protein
MNTLSDTKHRMEDCISTFQERHKACNARIRDSLEYAIFLTMEYDELCCLYFKYLGSADVRNKIIRHIKNKADVNKDQIPSWYLDKLMQDFYAAEGRQRISLGTAIKELSSFISQDKIRVFVERQLLSHSVLDRKRAFAIADAYYHTDFELILLKSWSTFEDSGALNTLVKHASDQQLAEIFPAIWASEDVKFYIRNNALKRVAKFEFAKVEFIRTEHPVSYLSACVAAGKDISDDFILDVARSATSINELGYVVWCTGKLAKRNVLDCLMDEIEVIESKLPIEYWEPEFYEIT